MRDRIFRLTNKVASGVLEGMTQVEREDWDDALEDMGWQLSTFGDDLKDADLRGIDSVARAVKRVEREQINVSDPTTRRAVDSLLSDVARILNTAEGENRRMEDLANEHKSKCMAILREVQSFKGKFEALKGG